jgi:hypothetical protein
VLAQSPPPAEESDETPFQSARTPAAAASPSGPFSGFEPTRRKQPDPAPLQRVVIAEGPALGRLRMAVLALSSLLCLAIGFIAGEIVSLKRQAPDAPIFSPEETSASLLPDSRPRVPPTPARTDSAPPAASVPESGTPDAISSASRAALEAFFNAPGWAARATYVIDPTAAANAMRAYAGDHGDGPIEATSIKLLDAEAGFHHYQVTTPSMPEGFPVTVFRRDGRWLIDWDMFVEMKDDLFKVFAAGNGGSTGTFHLFVKPGGEGNASFRGYRLTAPIKGRSYTGFAKVGSSAQARLTAILDSEANRSDTTFQRMLADQGIPVVLQLSTKANAGGKRFISIDDLIALGWGAEP